MNPADKHTIESIRKWREPEIEKLKREIKAKDERIQLLETALECYYEASEYLEVTAFREDYPVRQIIKNSLSLAKDKAEDLFNIK